MAARGHRDDDNSGCWLWIGRVGKLLGVIAGVFATITLFTNPNNAPVVSGVLMPFHAFFHWLEGTLPSALGQVIVFVLKLVPTVLVFIVVYRTLYGLLSSLVRRVEYEVQKSDLLGDQSDNNEPDLEESAQLIERLYDTPIQFQVGERLRWQWRRLFTLPTGAGADNPWGKSGWSRFAYQWLWSIAGAIPGALAAAYAIGRFHIADQRLQDSVSVGSAFLSMLLIQVIIYTLLLWPARATMLQFVRLARTDWTATNQEEAGSLWKMFVVIFQYLAAGLAYLVGSFVFPAVPFVLAAGAVYWYFTHASASSDLAARGTGGALALKVLLTLINVVVWPAVKAVFLKGLWQWVRGTDGRTPKPG